MLPPTVSPPWLARNVVPGCSSVSSSALRKKKSLFLMIGPETQPPSFLKSKVPLVDRGILGLGAHEPFVAEPVVERTAEVVAAAAGDRVDASADEVALTDVVGGHVDLDLLDGRHGDGGNAGSVARRTAETKGVVEVGAVHREVVEAVVLAGEGAVAARLGRQLGEGVDAIALRGQRRQRLTVDCRGGTRAGRAEDRVGLRRDDHLFGDRKDGQLELEVLGHTKAQGDVLGHDGLEAVEGGRDGVRAAHPHAGDVEVPVGPGDDLIAGARGLVDGEHGGTGNSLLLRVGDDARHRAGGHALCEGAPDRSCYDT